VIATIAANLVDFARRRAVAVVLAATALAVGAGWYAAGHLAIDTDVTRMLPPDLPWRQRDIAFDRAFPQLSLIHI